MKGREPTHLRAGTLPPQHRQPLSKTISSIFQKQLSKGDITALMETLKSTGKITIQGTKVSYSL